jgi:hypothetical protein
MPPAGVLARLCATRAARLKGRSKRTARANPRPSATYRQVWALLPLPHGVHTREKNPQAWTAYKHHVGIGRIFHPIGKSFLTFCRETLERKGAGVPFKRGADPSPFSNFRFGMPESDM